MENETELIAALRERVSELEGALMAKNRLMQSRDERKVALRERAAELEGLIESSDLELKPCGGLMGEPIVDRLRPKGELAQAEERTKFMQKLAGAMKYLVMCIPHLPVDLAAKVETFIGKTA